MKGLAQGEEGMDIAVAAKGGDKDAQGKSRHDRKILRDWREVREIHNGLPCKRIGPFLDSAALFPMLGAVSTLQAVADTGSTNYLIEPMVILLLSRPGAWRRFCCCRAPAIAQAWRGAAGGCGVGAGADRLTIHGRARQIGHRAVLLDFLGDRPVWGGAGGDASPAGLLGGSIRPDGSGRRGLFILLYAEFMAAAWC